MNIESLKKFLSKPVFILVPFIVFVPLTHPQFTTEVDHGVRDIALVGFPLNFIEIIDVGFTDGPSFTFSIFPFIVDIIFHYCVFLLISYWIFQKKSLKSNNKNQHLRSK
jgi:hypothetical protein